MVLLYMHLGSFSVIAVPFPCDNLVRGTPGALTEGEVRGTHAEVFCVDVGLPEERPQHQGHNAGNSDSGDGQLWRSDDVEQLPSERIGKEWTS